MEESISLKDFLTYYKQCMKLEPVDAQSYSPLVLAYIGDAVYEVMIRTKVINRGSMQVNKMHKHSSELVKAGAQAALFKAIEEELTEEEHSCLQPRPQCQILYHGEECHYDRLPHGYGTGGSGGLAVPHRTV